MKKISYAEVCDIFFAHNRGRNLSQFSDENKLTAVAVIKASSFDKPYSETERSYKFTSDNKAFIGACGNSIFADCLDGVDLGVRLDWYLHEGGWKIDYCYIL
jgi:hypothetical protein